MPSISFIVAAVAGALLIASPSEGRDPHVTRGSDFAQENCNSCHAVGRVGDSPLPNAPPFRTLHLRYPVETLEEALAEGIRTRHPGMPEFELDPNQIQDLIAYLKSLED